MRPKDGFKVVSECRGSVLYLSIAYIPLFGVELGSILTWGSGRETWGRRRRAGAVSSQSIFQSLQERAEAEEGCQAAVGEVEAAQLEVRLRSESS